MSHQPSTTDKVKDAASSAYESLVNTVSPVSENQGKYDPDKDKSNFAKDSHGNIFKKGDYKDKLNEAARGSPPQAEEGYVEKGTLYNILIPTLTKEARRIGLPGMVIETGAANDISALLYSRCQLIKTI
jgi:hypothetical protein